MEINLKAQPFDLAFHPSERLLATGLISGRIHLYKFGAEDEARKLWSLRPHKQSCRTLRFIDGGKTILSASPDRSIQSINVETGQALARLSDAHEAAINRMEILTETTVATGDDGGSIKIWDTRQNACCGTIKAHEDYVTDMEFASNTMQLLSVGGDGVLCLINLRRSKVDAKSEFCEGEMLSVSRVKNGRKVVCGTEEGVMLLYSWGEFGDCDDRFVGHPQSVEAIVKLDEDTVVTGSGDGLVRIVSVLPNKMKGVIGEHGEYPVERLAFSSDRQILGSTSHDHVLKLWDIQNLMAEDQHPSSSAAAAAGKDEEDGDDDADADDDDDMDMDVDDSKQRKGKKKKEQQLQKTKMKTKQDFFSDLL